MVRHVSYTTTLLSCDLNSRTVRKLPEFNLGDVVQLKSKGPNMTVIKLPDSDANNEESRTTYQCTWWNSPLSKYEKHIFLEEALESVPPHLIG
jgi:uncharacterized protein YodC (DUF2158 family)